MPDARQVPVRYVRALDQHDLGTLENLLTEDATWTITVAGRPESFTGRAAILAFTRSSWAGEQESRRHHLTNVAFDETEAGPVVAHAYLLVTSGAGLITTGSYAFTLHRIGDEWRIAGLLLDLDAAPQ